MSRGDPIEIMMRNARYFDSLATSIGEQLEDLVVRDDDAASVKAVADLVTWFMSARREAASSLFSQYALCYLLSSARWKTASSGFLMAETMFSATFSIPCFQLRDRRVDGGHNVWQWDSPRHGMSSVNEGQLQFFNGGHEPFLLVSSRSPNTQKHVDWHGSPSAPARPMVSGYTIFVHLAG